jgi:phosphatidylserine/phosphatidylglycerophosphate/cardiolipin synthase-like enzyme
METNKKTSPDGSVRRIDREELYKNLAFRLITQNRPNPDICFPISTIKTLFYRNGEKAFFDGWVKHQIDHVAVLTKDAEYTLSEVSAISILKDGSVAVQPEGLSQPVDLYSNRADKSERFKVCVESFKQVVLDHVPPMREILIANRANLPALCGITKRLYEADRFITTGQELRKAGSALLEKGVIHAGDVPGLKKDLEVLGRQIRLQFDGPQENLRKRWA